MKEKIVLIGAGSAMFTRGLVTDIIDRGWDCVLALVDIDPEALAAAEGLARKMVELGHAQITVSAHLDRREALPGATAVICTVGVGGRQAWMTDIEIPRKYGIYQPVGDSVLPGGSSRALRIIHAMVGVAEDVLKLAPEALFFNYGNPMAPVCRGIRKATGANVVGLCHGVYQVGVFLADALGVEPARTSCTAVGTNHLTWFTQFWVDGKDAMPRLHEYSRARLGELEGKETSDGSNVFTWRLFELFGAYPAVYDRHVMEFFPQMFSRKGSYYGKTPGVDVYSMEEIIRYGDDTYTEMKVLAAPGKPLPEGYLQRTVGEHEQVTQIIESVRQDKGEFFSANLPNTGQLPNLPMNAIVEGPAVADAAGLRPIAQPPLPAALVGTLANRFAWQETIVEAALEGSREKFVQALVIDGAVESIETAYKLADELLAAQAQYLPRFASSVP